MATQKQTIYDRICLHLGELSVQQLEKECGLGNGVIKKWSEHAPTANKLLIVAEKLGVSVDYLLGREECPACHKNFSDIFNSTVIVNSPNSNNGKSDSEIYNEIHGETLLLHAYRKLPDEAKLNVYVYCDGLLSFGLDKDVHHQKRSLQYISLFSQLIAYSPKFWELSLLLRGAGEDEINYLYRTLIKLVKSRGVDPAIYVNSNTLKEIEPKE